MYTYTRTHVCATYVYVLIMLLSVSLEMIQVKNLWPEKLSDDIKELESQLTRLSLIGASK